MVRGPGWGKTYSQAMKPVRLSKMRSFYKSKRGKAARVQAYAGKKYRR